MSRHLCQLPRSRVTPSLVASSALAAVDPSAQIALGGSPSTGGTEIGRRSPSHPAAACDSPEAGTSPRCRCRRPARRIGMPSLDAVLSIICVSSWPGAADERQALRVFIRARPFADEHQPGLLVARAEHDLRPLPRTAGSGGNRPMSSLNLFERIAVRRKRRQCVGDCGHGFAPSRSPRPDSPGGSGRRAVQIPSRPGRDKTQTPAEVRSRVIG